MARRQFRPGGRWHAWIRHGVSLAAMAAAMAWAHPLWAATILIDTGPAPATAAPQTPASQAAASQTAASQTAASQTGAVQAHVLIPLVVPLIINHKEAGDIDVAVDALGHGTVDGARLEELLQGLIVADSYTALTRNVAGRKSVPLNELSVPGLVFAFDPGTLEMHVDIDLMHIGVEKMDVFGRTEPDLKQMRAPARISSALTATVEQRFTRSLGRNTQLPLSVNLDGFLTVGGFEGTTARFGGTWTDTRSGAKWQRAQTRISHDFFNSALRLTAGEFDLPVTGFQGSNTVLGFSLTRDYEDIRPFQNIHPAGRSALTLDRESTVIIIVNGMESRRLRLNPGRYEFSDFGVPYGSSTVQLMVEDIAGRREAAALSLFNSINLLGRGITEYGISGALRPGLNPGSYSGAPLVSGYWRRGFSDHFTAGVGGQGVGSNWLASGEVTAGTRFGIIGLTSAYSRFQGRTGTANAIDFRNEFLLPHGASLIATFSAETRSANFESPVERSPMQIDERWRVDTRLEWRRAMTTIALGLHAEDFRHSPPQRSMELTASTSFGRVSTALTVGVERSPSGRYGTYAMIGLNLRFGVRTSVDARYDTHSDHLRSVDVTRFADQKVGDLSGRIAVDQDSRHTEVSGNLDYFGNRLVAQAETNTAYADAANGGNTRQSRVRLSSAIAFADGSWSIGRPSSRGFILLPLHDSLKGASVVVHDEADRVIARNGWLGPPLVPIDTPYVDRTYTYDVDRMPDGYNLGDTAPHVFPGAATGYRLQVGTAHWKMAMGYLLDNGAPVAQRTAIVTSETDKDFAAQTIFTNSAGRFVIDGLGPGTYDITYDDVIVARLTIPKDKQGLINVGKINMSHRRP